MTQIDRRFFGWLRRAVAGAKSRWRKGHPIRLRGWKRYAAALTTLGSTGSPGLAFAGDQTPHVLFAFERAATGAELWGDVQTICLQGVIAAGDAPGVFTLVMDHRTGHSRLIVDTGGFHEDSGFDGEIWDTQNGITTIADLPSFLLDANSDAFVARDGWWRVSETKTARTLPQRSPGAVNSVVIEVTPPHGSPLEVWLDRRSHLVTRIVAHTDGGVRTTVLSDWRTVAGVRLPFRRVQTDATGQVTALIAHSASVGGGAPCGALARPFVEDHAELAGEAPTTVPFRFTALTRGHVVVAAVVNDKAATVIFDTGAANYFEPSAAKRLGLGVGGGVNIGGVGTGSITGGFAKVRRISIGAAALSDQTVVVGALPYPAIHPRAGMDIDGLAGFEFLSKFRTTIDYGRRTLSFSRLGQPVTKAAMTLPFYSDGHDIFVDAAIEGARGLFRLDTGDGGAVTVFRAFAEREKIFQGPGRIKVSAGGVGGTLALRDFRSDRLTFAGQKFSRVPVEVSQSEAGSFASRSIAGNIGAGLLSRFRVTFDYRARTVSFEPQADAKRPFRRDRIGLQIDQSSPAAFSVLSVTPGSPAAKAGIVAKDLIVAVDGRSVAEQRLGIFDLAAPRFDIDPIALQIKRGPDLINTIVVPADYQEP
ncbi:MAG: aspartyl protease family protein [Caulobacteraceae bacterium]